MRLGVYGGTFDPVHFGHLLLAECCREQARLDEVWFVPAAIPPHKQSSQVGAAEHRLEMLRLAVSGYSEFVVSDCELRRGGVSYTVDTLEEIRAARPNDELFFLLGADALNDLIGWRAPARIIELATLVAVHRADAAAPNWAALEGLFQSHPLESGRAWQVEMPRIDFSSRELRARVSRGESIRFRTAPSVEDYIQRHGLYRNRQETGTLNEISS
ncbi:MAG TPA: nicotinate-nucleotide adenylyltransferase [Pirellulaceae bacterium]|nr:nicotinate-nucleotide adenylyltransferase [Pirellulaceae bacterium]